MLKYLELCTKEIQNQVIYKNFFNDLDDYIYNYKELEKEYNHSQKIIDNLEEECEKLNQKNNNLNDFVRYILEMLKDFLEAFYFLKTKLIKIKL